MALIQTLCWPTPASTPRTAVTSVVSNDSLGYLNGSAVTSSGITVAANAPSRGTVNMTTSGANVGKFTYTPNPGFTGIDTFTYTISNGVAGGNATSITGRVIITVGGPVIWYVDPNAATSGNGTLGSPFKTLAEAITAISTTGQRIFLYTSATTQSGNFVLTNNAWLVVKPR